MATFDWSSLLGKGALLKKGGDITVDSLSSKDVVGFYFSAHWCPPCRRFTPVLAKAYSTMTKGSNCEIVFVSGDQDDEAFKKYHAEMPFAALSFSSKDINSALNKKFGCEGIPYLVLCDGKTGETLTTEGRTCVSKHGPAFALEAPKIIAQKAAAAAKVKDLSILGDKVLNSAGAPINVSGADVVAVAFGDPNNRGWAQFVKSKLVEASAKLVAAGKKFSVVVSGDEKAIPDNWAILPKGTNSELFDAMGDMGAPSVLVLGKGKGGEFEVLVNDAVQAVYEHGAAAYPWTAEGIAAGERAAKARIAEMMKGMEDLRLLKENGNIIGGVDGKKVSIADIQKTAGVIGLYFSAHWCGPCRSFTPRLAELYKECRDAGKAFEVVFVSSDRDQDSFNEYFGEMPWKALAFSERGLKKDLSDIYGVGGIPTLVLLTPDGKVITKSGRDAVSVGAEYFPWTSDQMEAGRKAQREKEAKKAAAAVAKEEAEAAAAEADGAVVLRRFSGIPGNSPMERLAGQDSVYDISFGAFDTFATTNRSASSGTLYFEVECVSVGNGIAQVGFADEKFSAGRGDGVGDDSHSWGFDGNRVSKWGDGSSSSYGKGWKDGDILGCLASLDDKKVEFFLNDESMGVAFEGITFTGALRPAVTAQGRNYKLRVNVGKALKYSH